MKSSRRLITTADTRASVTAVTPTKLSVRRSWSDGRVRERARPPSRRTRPGSRRTSRRAGAGPSAFGERVADSTDRQHELRGRRIVLDLVAQMADVDVDRLVVLIEGLVVANQLEQLRSGIDAAG